MKQNIIVNETKNSALTFDGMGIAPRLIQTLDRIHITTPTPIQQKAIPPGLAGHDIIGIAQTGTGKTLAFAIPILQGLAQKKGKALILVPTRELAMQVSEEFYKIGYSFGMKMAVLIGGASMYNQIRSLRNYPRIIIATPGRLIDHLEHMNVNLGDTCILVLDEADRMLDMGFYPQIETILRKVPKERQTMLFSASIPETIVKIAATYMKLPINIAISPSGTAAEHVSQEIFIVKREMKPRLLNKLLHRYTGPVLLFSRTKIGAGRITRMLRDMGHNAAEIHSDRSLGQRREALEGFKTGRYRILVATDIAARGIDVHGIEVVVNYDLPDETENYIHRIGRTGRAGHSGHAISFATPDQGDDVKKIERLMRINVPISTDPEIPSEKFEPTLTKPAFSSWRRKSGGGMMNFRGGGRRRNFRIK